MRIGLCTTQYEEYWVHTILADSVIREDVLGTIQEQGFLPGQYQRRYDMVVKQVPYSGVAGCLGCLNRAGMVVPGDAPGTGLAKQQSWPNMISSGSFPRTIVIHIGKFQER
jgi:hypothetical protein